MADFVLQTGNKKLWPKSVTECDFLSLIVTFCDFFRHLVPVRKALRNARPCDIIPVHFRILIRASVGA